MIALVLKSATPQNRDGMKNAKIRMKLHSNAEATIHTKEYFEAWNQKITLISSYMKNQKV